MTLSPYIGRSWLDDFFAGWRNTFTNLTLPVANIASLEKDYLVDDIKRKLSTVFNRDFSSPIVGFTGDLILKEDKPIFKKAYQVPLRLRQRVLDYLDELEKME